MTDLQYKAMYMHQWPYFTCECIEVTEWVVTLNNGLWFSIHLRLGGATCTLGCASCLTRDHVSLHQSSTGNKQVEVSQR